MRGIAYQLTYSQIFKKNSVLGAVVLASRGNRHQEFVHLLFIFGLIVANNSRNNIEFKSQNHLPYCVYKKGLKTKYGSSNYLKIEEWFVMTICC
jgi:hypothetical protein